MSDYFNEIKVKEGFVEVSVEDNRVQLIAYDEYGDESAKFTPSQVYKLIEALHDALELV